MRIEREHAAAIVVDYQEKLMPVMDRREALIENSSILLAGLRTLGIPMVLTQQYTKGLGPGFYVIRSNSPRLKSPVR